MHKEDRHRHKQTHTHTYVYTHTETHIYGILFSPEEEGYLATCNLGGPWRIMLSEINQRQILCDNHLYVGSKKDKLTGRVE